MLLLRTYFSYKTKILLPSVLLLYFLNAKYMIFLQTKLLEEEEKEKREEEERKERKRAKEREKKLRRKERLKGKDKNKEGKFSESNDVPSSPEAVKEELSAPADTEQNNALSCKNSVVATDEPNLSNGDYHDIQDEEFSSECSTLRAQDCAYDDYDGDIAYEHDRNGTNKVEQPKFYRQRLRYRKEFQVDMSSKWSDRYHNSVVSENGGGMVGRSEPRHYGDNFGTSSRGISGLNRQSKVNVPKINGRNVGHNCNEKFYNSNYRMSEKYDFHSCSCSPNSRVTRGSREIKAVSKSETAVDTSRQFYRGSKYNQVDMHESSGRPKSRVFSGNYPSRDMLESKKVWEPTESLNKYARSNSDSDVTLRSTGQVSQFDPVRSPVDEVDDSGEIDNDSDLKRHGMTEGCQNDLDAEAEGSCSSTEIGSEEPEISVTRLSAMNNSSDHSQGSISSSDNCSSCLSEGDNNTTSSNRENTEFSNSDSEDASQKYEVTDSSTCVDNGVSDCCEPGIDKTHIANGEGLSSRSLSVPSLDVVESEAFVNPVLETAQNFENSFSSPNVCSQPESILPPMPNRNIQFPVFQTPSAMGYYHQNQVSWPTAPANGLMPFVHPNNYLYAGPLGYNLNEDPRFCLQYGALQQPTPQFNPAAIPVYHPVARGKGLNGEELSQISIPASMQDHFNESIAERVVPAAANSRKAGLNGEDRLSNSAKSQESNGGFSLFHFGGPVAFSNERKTATASSDNVGDFNSKSLHDQVEKDNGCNKKETAFIEEYNLFAASNTLRFTIF